MAKIVKQTQSQTVRYDDEDEPPRRRRRKRTASEIIILLVIYFGALVVSWHLLPQLGIVSQADLAVASIAISLVVLLVATKLLPRK